MWSSGESDADSGCPDHDSVLRRSRLPDPIGLMLLGTEIVDSIPRVKPRHIRPDGLVDVVSTQIIIFSCVHASL